MLKKMDELDQNKQYMGKDELRLTGLYVQQRRADVQKDHDLGNSKCSDYCKTLDLKFSSYVQDNKPYMHLMKILRRCKRQSIISSLGSPKIKRAEKINTIQTIRKI